MNKNWYAVYTKAQCEKKVASLLTKKKIENFCPLNRRFLNSQNSRKKILHEPLFPSFVFVFITQAEMSVVRQTTDVINFLYWLEKPAAIRTAEIEHIDIFVNTYFNVRLEKNVVNPNGVIKIIKQPVSDFDLEIITSSNIKISLPSLGYILATEVEKSIAESYNPGPLDTN